MQCVLKQVNINPPPQTPGRIKHIHSEGDVTARGVKSVAMATG